MQTLFKLVPEGQNPLKVDITSANPTLPAGMHMERRNDGLYMVVDTPVEEDEDAQLLVQRELDRLFFLSGLRMQPAMIRRIVAASFGQTYLIHQNLPEHLGTQDWNPKLALQLRLWRVGMDTVDRPTRLLIFFQIIELQYPDSKNATAYPSYRVVPLHPRTEAKLLRNIVAHAGQATSADTRWYLEEHLKLGDMMMADRSDPRWNKIINEKADHVQGVAVDAIEEALGYSSTIPLGAV